MNQKRHAHNDMQAYSLVGSPDYMAPEILENKGYDYKVDYWSVGCILFEFLCGFAPFTAPTTEELWVNLVNWKQVLQRPHYEGHDSEFNLSDEAWDLIVKYVIICKEEDFHPSYSMFFFATPDV
jgi:cell cycle protein kinase DBF2